MQQSARLFSTIVIIHSAVSGLTQVGFESVTHTNALQALFHAPTRQHLSALVISGECPACTVYRIQLAQCVLQASREAVVRRVCAGKHRVVAVLR